MFDTVITRAVSPPRAVFAMLGAELRAAGLTGMLAGEFAATRVRAEVEAAGRDDATAINMVTLGGIYERLVAAGAVRGGDAEHATEMELDLERRLSRPVPGMIERVQAARGGGARVAFLSDMYLPEGFIRGLLQMHGVWREGDTLLVSSALKVDKRSGGMYEELARRMGVRAGDIVHVGDNPVSDVRAAWRAGVRAEHATPVGPSRFTDVLERACDTTGGLSGCFAGASRLSTVNESDARRYVAAHVAAPVLGAFVLWVLARAKQMGLGRLYFLARDGQVLVSIARRLERIVGPGPELWYLYASRQAWHLPSVTAIGEAERSWLLAPARNLTLGRLLGRVELKVEDVRGALQAAGLGTDERQLIDASDLEKARAVFDDADVVRLVLERAAAARAITTDYLRLAGLMKGGLVKDTRWAIVDVGWSARSQASLAKILAAAGGGKPRGLYFGLGKTFADGEFGTLEGFAFDRRKPGGGADVPSLETFIELFCAADHGMVTAYAMDRDGVVPVLRETENSGPIRWGLADMRDGITRGLEQLVVPPEWEEHAAAMGPVVLEVMRELTTRPTMGEARAFASFPFDDDQSGEGHAPLARPFTPARLLKRLVTGPVPERASWPAGAVAISPPLIRATMRLAARLRPRRS